MSSRGSADFTGVLSCATEIAKIRTLSFFGKVSVFAPAGNGSEYANRYEY
jgi:hypothetical protein